MNKNNLQQIFANYIDRFEELNDPDYNESFKWWAAAQFHAGMEEALRKGKKEFIEDLKKIVRKDIVGVIIDGKMRPFRGLAAIAEKNDGEFAEDVKALFAALFEDDGGDLARREAKIAAFLQGAEKLRLATYPDYYSYKQTARSVAGYLFLYDPDHHYMYKATETHRFADVVEYYGDWGSGDQIRLREYYRMCDELVAEIRKCPALLETDETRYLLKERFEKDPPYGKINSSAEIMKEDTSYHILAYDIIYCNSTYDLDRGLSFKKVSLKEKKLYEERLKKAQEQQEKYLEAEEHLRQLEQAERHYNAILVPGTKVRHTTKGEGIILDRNKGDITVQFESGTLRFDLHMAVAERYLKFDDPLDDAKEALYRQLCRNHTNIRDRVVWHGKELKAYSDVLE